jgi:hypothetical protein
MGLLIEAGFTTTALFSKQLHGTSSQFCTVASAARYLLFIALYKPPHLSSNGKRRKSI